MIWDVLDAEFAAWRAADRVIPFWWRDDDAVAKTPALQRMVGLSNAVNVPVHMAVIPENLQDSLVHFTHENNALIPVVHGFSHTSHARVGEKNCEFPSHRDMADARRELTQGYETLSSAFGKRLSPMFVPPWNRLDPCFMIVLQDIGYKWFSTFTSRSSRWATANVEQVNTHVDPIDWHGSRSLVDPETILDHVVSTLQARRLGVADAAEPLGFLTHHLVHDPEIWSFTETFLRKFAEGPTRIWTAVQTEKRE